MYPSDVKINYYRIRLLNSIYILYFSFQGNDLICQSKAGSGKTAVFVFSILNQIK